MKIAQRLFYFNAFVWLGIGIITLFNLTYKNTLTSLAGLIIAILVVGNSAAMLLAGIGLGRRKKFFLYFALLVLGVNILLSITDEFGLLDLLTMLYDVGMLAYLLWNRRIFAG